MSTLARETTKRPSKDAVFLYRVGRSFHAHQGDSLFAVECRCAHDAVNAARRNYGDDAEIWVLADE